MLHCVVSSRRALCFAVALCARASPAPVAADNGMVVTVAQHPRDEVGVEVLKEAATRSTPRSRWAALAVVYPAPETRWRRIHAPAPGRRAEDLHRFPAKAPLAATRDMYLDKSGAVIPNASLIGHLAVAVPGSVAGLEYARAKYGTLPREPLIAPPSRLAEDGFVLQQGDVTFSPKRRGLRTIRPAPRSSLDKGNTRAAGAASCRRTLPPRFASLTPGADGFYRGRVAEMIACIQPRGRQHPDDGRSCALQARRWRPSSAIAATGLSPRRRRVQAACPRRC